MVTDLLKTETEDIHRELEQLEFAQALLNSPQPALYRQILVRWFDIDSTYLDRAKMPQLRRLLIPAIANLCEDLRGLHWSPREPIEMPIRFDPTSEAHELGALYVLGGSFLGARVIARHLAKSPHAAVRENRRYFAGADDSTAHDWQAIKDTLNEWPSSDADNRELTGAAQLVFDDMRRCLSLPLQ